MGEFEGKSVIVTGGALGIGGGGSQERSQPKAQASPLWISTTMPETR